MATIATLDDIRDEFEYLDTPEERMQYLVELGQTLPDFPPTACTEENRVLGCQSMVWLVAAHDGPKLRFTATSDAPMVRGLIAVLLAAYTEKTPQEILQFPIESLFGELKLTTFLTPMRSNGLHSMVKRILAIAEAQSQALDGSRVSPIVRAASIDQPEAVSNAFGDLAETRADFPILSRQLADGQILTYLDNAASTQRPRQVIDALSEVYERYYSNVHRGGHELAAETTSRYEAAREAVREFVNARETAEILFTSGTTAGINLVARAWGDANVRSGDEVLLSIMEHHSNIVPWQQLAARTGCRIRWLPVRDDGELDLEQLPNLLTSRTKLVAITAVSNVLGTINPVRTIVDRSHQAGAVVLVDAAQAAPHERLDVRQWDADFVAFSGHKMLGPSGVGVLYGRRAILEAMPPFLGGGSMIKSVTLDGFTPADLPYKFEAGTPPIVDAIGLKPAIDYLKRVGMDRILAHEQQLSRRAHQLLAEIPGMHFWGPPIERKGGLVTFTVDGLHPDEIAKVLDSRGIAVRAGHHCAMPLHDRLGISASCRASFYFYNTLSEVDRLHAGVVSALRILKRK